MKQKSSILDVRDSMLDVGYSVFPFYTTPYGHTKSPSYRTQYKQRLSSVRQLRIRYSTFDNFRKIFVFSYSSLYLFGM